MPCSDTCFVNLLLIQATIRRSWCQDTITALTIMTAVNRLLDGITLPGWSAFDEQNASRKIQLAKDLADQAQSDIEQILLTLSQGCLLCTP